MLVATLEILDNISEAEFQQALIDEQEKIEALFLIGNKKVLYDLKPHILAQDEIGLAVVKTFNFGSYIVTKEDINVTIYHSENTFVLKAAKATTINEETLVDSCQIKLKTTTNTGNVTGQILSEKTFDIDIDREITTEEKNEFIEIGLTLTGQKWNEFTILGKSKVSFEKKHDNTVFVGNKTKGFLTQ